MQSKRMINLFERVTIKTLLYRENIDAFKFLSLFKIIIN